MTFEEWIKYGYDQGFCGPPVCYTHDGVPMTEEEDNDEEPCIHIVRLYEDQGQRKAVEENHSPSVWRATNRGWTQ